jgi:5-(carboxyamino)imidazole ribonucleotide synthase
MSELNTIGILGAGQLAMMLSEAAANLGVTTVVFAPGQALHRPVGDRLIEGSLDDADALGRFADLVDVITFETENISIDTVDAVSDRALVRPSIEAVRVAQDRLVEKRFVASVGARTAPYADLDPGAGSDAELRAAAAAAFDVVTLPAIVKTRRLGYDGKGQVRLGPTAGVDELVAAWQDLGAVPCIIEGFVAFDDEISVVAARSVDGDFVAFDPGTNRHAEGILRTTSVPTDVPESAVAAAIDHTRALLDAFDYVGVAGVEFFVTGEDVLVNELAPRVHNSGHWTQVGCVIDQFEQHVRAITGRPLGDGHRLVDVEMENLIGHDLDQLPAIVAEPAAAVVLYGKADVRPGRKMGHVNRVQPKPGTSARGRGQR